MTCGGCDPPGRRDALKCLPFDSHAGRFLFLSEYARMRIDA
jgi:hypothetical protein